LLYYSEMYLDLNSRHLQRFVLRKQKCSHAWGLHLSYKSTKINVSFCRNNDFEIAMSGLLLRVKLSAFVHFKQEVWLQRDWVGTLICTLSSPQLWLYPTQTHKCNLGTKNWTNFMFYRGGGGGGIFVVQNNKMFAVLGCAYASIRPVLWNVYHNTWSKLLICTWYKSLCNYVYRFTLRRNYLWRNKFILVCNIW
jgi:hypothetical protein